MAGLHHLGKELYQTAHVQEKWISPMSDLPICPAEESDQDQIDDQEILRVINSSNVKQPQLRRDPRVIRQQYLTQLGINLSSSTLERAIGRKRPIEGFKVKLKDSDTSSNRFSSSILQAISNWYNGSETYSSQSDEDEVPSVSSDLQTDDIPKRKVGFNEEAEVFLIPLHNEYTVRQRRGMWHSREEFMSMVERNLEAMYIEMEREYEEYQKAEKMNNLSTPSTGLSTSVLNTNSIFAALDLSEVTRKKLTRSPHEIRSKYLLQLGIDR